MNIQGLLKKPALPLAVFFSTLGSAYLSIVLFKYTFFPFDGLMTNVFTTGIILWLTIKGVKNKNMKTKTTDLCAAIIPLLAIGYLILKSMASDMSDTSYHLLGVTFSVSGMVIYALHAFITLMCSMITFVSCKQKAMLKIVLGILYGLLLCLISFILFAIVLLPNFGERTVIKVELSPNAEYSATIINADSGALGGATNVLLAQPKQDINLLLGVLKKDPTVIYRGNWGESFHMELRWETDELLYINGVPYLINEYF